MCVCMMICILYNKMMHWLLLHAVLVTFLVVLVVTLVCATISIKRRYYYKPAINKCLQKLKTERNHDKPQKQKATHPFFTSATPHQEKKQEQEKKQKKEQEQDSKFLCFAMVFNCNQRLRKDPDGFQRLFSYRKCFGENPSILLLQEVEHTEDVQALETMDEKNWTVVAWEPRSELAIAVNENVWQMTQCIIERMPDDDFYRNAAVIARLQHRKRPDVHITVMSVHLSSLDYKQDETTRVEEIHWLMQRMKQYQVDLVGGDFNSISHLDQYDVTATTTTYASHIMHQHKYIDIGSRDVLHQYRHKQEQTIKSGANWFVGTWLGEDDDDAADDNNKNNDNNNDNNTIKHVDTSRKSKIERIDRAYLTHTASSLWDPTESHVWIITPDEINTHHWPTGKDHACLYLCLCTK